MTVQTKFTLTLPVNDNAGNALPANALTAVVVAIAAGSGAPVDYTYNLPAGTANGAAITIPFTALGFSAVGDVAYTADCWAVDSNGNGLPTASINWTEATVPAAPTGFTVA